jgi:hypothetical protein
MSQRANARSRAGRAIARSARPDDRLRVIRRCKEPQRKTAGYAAARLTRALRFCASLHPGYAIKCRHENQTARQSP